MIPSYVFRAKARQVIKPVMQILAVIALVAMLPGLISSTVSMITKSDPNDVFAPYISEMQTLLETGVTQEDQVRVLTELQTAFDVYLQGKFPIFAGMSLLDFLLTPALSMGLYHALICALRKEEISMWMALPGMRRFFKAIVVHLVTILRCLLWMLPGMALSLAGVFVPDMGGIVMILAGWALAIVLGVRAVYSYSLAMFFLADHPETSSLACIRRSKEVMKGRRMEMFMLEISFLGWNLLIMLLQSMIIGMFGAVIGLTLGMFAALFLNVYMFGAKTAFYEAYAVHGVKRGQTIHAPEQGGDELN
ncbi:MAG: DUF975 family protein [Clostridia bacterium]|nr:DUF975 family protein [Clostridia bacterium]